MNEAIPVMPILIAAIVGLLIVYGRSLEKRKKKYTYRELTPEEILKKTANKTGGDIYGKRSSGHLDIDKFVKRRNA